MRCHAVLVGRRRPQPWLSRRPLPQSRLRGRMAVRFFRHGGPFRQSMEPPMKPLIALTACALTWSTTALAATRPYDTRAFEAVSVAAGITVEVTLGSPRSVVAETRGKDFDDLHISVEGDVLRIARPARSWFSLGRRADYRVRVVTPILHSVSASSGSEVTVNGNLQGDLAVEASSGSEVDITMIKGGALTARSSSGSEIHLAGSCLSLDAQASSGSDLDAEDLQCENEIGRA